MLENPSIRIFEFSPECQDEARALKEHWPNGVDILIVDSYQLDQKFETECRDWSKQIVVIDDLADRQHDCDLIIDSSPIRQAEEYSSLVPPGCKFLLGPAYALLRTGFARCRPEAVIRRKAGGGIKRLLINFGGTDLWNLTPMAIKAIAASKLEVDVDVLIGSGVTSRQEIEATIAKELPAAKLHIGLSDPTSLMMSADVAIGTGGGATWERCALGLPTIVVQTSANQSDVISALNDREAIWFIGQQTDLSVGKILDMFTSIAQNPGDLEKISDNASGICDGIGARRVAQYLMKPLAKDGGMITLRPISMADSDFILDLQREPEIRKFVQNPPLPEKEQHERWVTDRIIDPKCSFNIIFHENVRSGIVRLDLMESMRDEPMYCVTITTSPDKQGLGLGIIGIQLAHHLVPDAFISAEVYEENDASKMMLYRSGYEDTKDGFFLQSPLPRPITINSYK